jgi:hypothetical protein
MIRSSLGATLFSAAAILGSGSLGQGQDVSWVSPGSYHHASTAEEGAARGMADVIRSAGAANLMNSEAAINVEEARKRYIENREQATQTYFQMREMNKKYRYENRRPPSQEQLVRISKERLPDRLSESQLDPLTGSINWPAVLRSEPFAESRKRLEELAAARAQTGFLTHEHFMEVKQLAQQMKDGLRTITPRVSGNVSVQARKFLDSLVYEAGMQAS